MATLSVATAIAVGVLAFTVVAGGSGDAPHTEAKKMCAVGVLARGGC